MDYDELYHHGVLGMKWGEHRFGRDRRGYTRARNSGKSSAEIKKAAARDAAKADKKAAARVRRSAKIEKIKTAYKEKSAVKKAERKESRDIKKAERKETKQYEKIKGKSPSKMTNSELAYYTQRLQLENNLAQVRNQNKQANQGHQFISQVSKNIGNRVLSDVGSQVGTYYLGRAVNSIIGEDVVKTGGSNKKKNSDD